MAVAPDEDQVAGLDLVALERPAIPVIEEGDSAHAGVRAEVDGLARRADEARGRGHRQLVQPVLTILWAAVILAEPLTWPTVVGGAAVILCAGLAVRTRLSPKERP